MTINDDLLAGIRAHTVEMSNAEQFGLLEESDTKYLQLCKDILSQVKAGGVPLYPIKKFIEGIYSVPDLDVAIDYYTHDPESGQHVFKGDSVLDECSLCAELYEHKTHHNDSDHEPDYTY